MKLKNKKSAQTEAIKLRDKLIRCLSKVKNVRLHSFTADDGKIITKSILHSGYIFWLDDGEQKLYSWELEELSLCELLSVYAGMPDDSAA